MRGGPRFGKAGILFLHLEPRILYFTPVQAVGPTAWIVYWPNEGVHGEADKPLYDHPARSRLGELPLAVSRPLVRSTKKTLAEGCPLDRLKPVQGVFL